MLKRVLIINLLLFVQASSLVQVLNERNGKTPLPQILKILPFTLTREVLSALTITRRWAFAFGITSEVAKTLKAHAPHCSLLLRSIHGRKKQTSFSGKNDLERCATKTKQTPSSLPSLARCSHNFSFLLPFLPLLLHGALLEGSFLPSFECSR